MNCVHWVHDPAPSNWSERVAHGRQDPNRSGIHGKSSGQRPLLVRQGLWALPPALALLLHPVTDRDRETERQRDRETERQRDRETERQRDRETERQRDGETERQRDRETERQRDRETERQRDRETERQRDRETKAETKTMTERFVPLCVSSLCPVLCLKVDGSIPCRNMLDDRRRADERCGGNARGNERGAKMRLVGRCFRQGSVHLVATNTGGNHRCMTCGWKWTPQAPELETEEWQFTIPTGVERTTGKDEKTPSIPQSETSEAHQSSPGSSTGTSSKSEESTIPDGDPAGREDRDGSIGQTSARLRKRRCKTRTSSPMRRCCSKPSNFHRNSKVSTRENATTSSTGAAGEPC